MNIKDPYSEFIKEIRKHGAYNNPSSIDLGEVTNNSPLTVNIGNLQLDNSNLLVSDYLLTNYSRQLQVSGTTQTYTAQNGLNVGDLVALIQVNSSTYIILSRVVSA